MAASIYDLPDLRPFRSIAHRMRLAGGAIVTENGQLASDDFDGTTFEADDSTTGWSIWGDGDVVFNSGIFRGILAASALAIDLDAIEIYNWDFGTDTDGWTADTGTTITRDTTVGFDTVTPRSLRLERTSTTGDARALSASFPVTGGLFYRVNTGIRTNAALALNSIAGTWVYVRWYDSDGALISETNELWLGRRSVGAAFPVDTWLTTQDFFGDDPATREAPYFIVTAAPTGAVTAQVVIHAEGITTSEDSWVAEGSVEQLAVASIGHVVADSAQIAGQHFTNRGIEKSISDSIIGGTPENPPEADGWGLFLRGTTEHGIRAQVTLGNNLDSGDDAVRITGSGLYLGFPDELAADELLDQLAAWPSYSPSHSNITTTGGTETARYMVTGKLCKVRWRFAFGVGSSIGTSARVGLPLAPVVNQVGIATYAVAGGRTFVGACLAATSDTRAPLYHSESGNNGAVNATNPFTFGAGDVLTMAVDYEIA